MKSPDAATDETLTEWGSRSPSVLLIPDHELIRCIGIGSYGEVWLARTLVGTLRAIKVVYRHTFEQEEHFEREFKGLQKFEPISRSHDGFVDILQLGRNQSAGYFYYVMELADDLNAECGVPSEGNYIPKTLRSEQRRLGRIPVNDCLDIALALTDALAHLHTQGLVHRDIKPSNIIFVNGKPKLADIGLVADISEAPSFVGTTGFIPPEGPGKAQADLYSLGKVLYEIALGKDRNDFPQLPPDLQAHPDHAEVLELNEIVLKACENDFRKRYQTAQQMHDELALLEGGHSVKRRRAMELRVTLAKKISVTAVALVLLALGGSLISKRFTDLTVQRVNGMPEVNSIAVLPFVNQSKSEPHEYLAAILSDETRNALTNCAGLRVTRRPAAFAFKRTTNNVLEIGEQLGVRTVLTGTMNKTSNQLYVAARLINVADGTELWSATYDRYRRSTDIGEITGQVVSNVVQVLKLSLPQSASRQMETNLVRKLRAYRLYSQARPLAWNTQDGNNKATELLNHAIAEDPNFAEAHATLAFCYSEATGFLLPPAQAMTAAKASALRAIALDDTLLNAHLALGTVFLLHELNFTNAEVEFQRAIALAPRDGGTYGYYGMALSFWGRFTDADQVLKQGEQADPKNHNLQGSWCRRYYLERRFPDMLRQVTQFQALHPKSVMGFLFLAQAHERLGNYAEALSAVERLNQMDPAPDSIALQGMIHARMGKQDEARKALEEIRVNIQSRRASPMCSAQVLLGLGQNEQAIEQLQRAVSEYRPTVLYLKTDPVWDDLRSDSQFGELLQKGGLEK